MSLSWPFGPRKAENPGATETAATACLAELEPPQRRDPFGEKSEKSYQGRKINEALKVGFGASFFFEFRGRLGFLRPGLGLLVDKPALELL